MTDHRLAIVASDRSGSELRAAWGLKRIAIYVTAVLGAMLLFAEPAFSGIILDSSAAEFRPSGLASHSRPIRSEDANRDKNDVDLFVVPDADTSTGTSSPGFGQQFSGLTLAAAPSHWLIDQLQMVSHHAIHVFISLPDPPILGLLRPPRLICAG
jgi:hypothetical protein